MILLIPECIMTLPRYIANYVLTIFATTPIRQLNSKQIRKEVLTSRLPEDFSDTSALISLQNMQDITFAFRGPSLAYKSWSKNALQSEFKSNTSELNYKQFQNKQKRLFFTRKWKNKRNKRNHMRPNPYLVQKNITSIHWRFPLSLQNRKHTFKQCRKVIITFDQNRKSAFIIL